MSNIKYNEKEEAFELPYKLWDEIQTVRFYVEEESIIMDNISGIAGKLALLDGSKAKLAEQLAGDGVYEGSAETLVKSLTLSNVYVDIEEDEDDPIIVCFTLDSGDGYMKLASMELYGEDFEPSGIG